MALYSEPENNLGHVFVFNISALLQPSDVFLWKYKFPYQCSCSHMISIQRYWCVMFYHLPFARAFKTVLRLLNFQDINVFYHKKFWLCYGAVLRKRVWAKLITEVDTFRCRGVWTTRRRLSDDHPIPECNWSIALGFCSWWCNIFRNIWLG